MFQFLAKVSINFFINIRRSLVKKINFVVIKKCKTSTQYWVKVFEFYLYSLLGHENTIVLNPIVPAGAKLEVWRCKGSCARNNNGSPWISGRGTRAGRYFRFLPKNVLFYVSPTLHTNQSQSRFLGFIFEINVIF